MLLFAITGAMLIGGARDLLLLFLALELLVLPGYMLAGYAKRDGLSTEGAIKYFLLGSFSSAIFLFGLVLRPSASPARPASARSPTALATAISAAGCRRWRPAC